jgi:hypothetical protein
VQQAPDAQPPGQRHALGDREGAARGHRLRQYGEGIHGAQLLDAVEARADGDHQIAAQPLERRIRGRRREGQHEDRSGIEHALAPRFLVHRRPTADAAQHQQRGHGKHQPERARARGGRFGCAVRRPARVHQPQARFSLAAFTAPAATAFNSVSSSSARP